MAEHGYARDYDEPIDRSEDDRGRWRGESREQRWRGREESDRNERNVNFMLDDRDRRWEGGPDRYRERERGYSGQMGEGARSSDRNEDRQYRGEIQRGWDQGSRTSQSGADWERSPRNFRSDQDDHYRSWRNRQMEALDRDYSDYCREREQQFHRDFDDWRQNRRSGQQPASDSVAVEAEREASHRRAMSEQGNTPSPVDAATLGTNNSENSGTGRAKPSA